MLIRALDQTDPMSAAALRRHGVRAGDMVSCAVAIEAAIGFADSEIGVSMDPASTIRSGRR